MTQITENPTIKTPNVVLIDGHALMYRSYHAVQFRPLYDGTPVNIAYGFWNTYLQAWDQFSPKQIIVTFDTPEPTFRHKADQNYKSQRTESPEDFYPQVPYLLKLLESFNIPIVAIPGFEADDVLGTLAREIEAKSELHTYILSGDLDLLQLVSPQISLAKFNGKTPFIFDRERTIEKLGITPEQVIDYKAICGDASDNYKGIPGVGPKGAIKLLNQYGTLDGIYQNIADLAPNLKSKFTESKDQASHCQHLAEIVTNVDLNTKLTKLLDQKLNHKSGMIYLEKLGFKSLYKKSLNMNKNNDQNIINESEMYSKKSRNIDTKNQQMMLF